MKIKKDDLSDKKTYLKNMSIDEVSLVPRGANQNAWISLTKIDTEVVAKRSFSEVMQEWFLDEKVEEMLDNMWDMNSAFRQAFHEIMRDPEVTNKKAAFKESMDQFSTAINAIVNETSVIKSREGESKGGKMSKELEDKLTKMSARLERSESIAKMDDQTKSYFNALKEDDQEGFLKASEEGQKDLVQKAADKAKAKADDIAKNDETFTDDGTTIRKSVVGEDAFNMMKKSAERAANSEKIAKEERDKRKLSEFTKQAELLYPNLPGKETDKGQVMKAIAGMPKEVNETISAMLKAGNQAFTGTHIYKELGGDYEGDGEGADALTKLNKLAEDKAKVDGSTTQSAYAKILKTNEGRALYAQSLEKE